MKVLCLISIMYMLTCSIVFADTANPITPASQQVFATASVLDEQAEGGITKEEKKVPMPPIVSPLPIDPELQVPSEDITEHPAVITPPVTDPEMTIPPPVTDPEMVVNPENLPAVSEEEVPTLRR